MENLRDIAWSRLRLKCLQKDDKVFANYLDSMNFTEEQCNKYIDSNLPMCCANKQAEKYIQDFLKKYPKVDEDTLDSKVEEYIQNTYNPSEVRNYFDREVRATDIEVSLKAEFCMKLIDKTNAKEQKKQTIIFIVNTLPLSEVAYYLQGDNVSLFIEKNPMLKDQGENLAQEIHDNWADLVHEFIADKTIETLEKLRIPMQYMSWSKVVDKMVSYYPKDLGYLDFCSSQDIIVSDWRTQAKNYLNIAYGEQVLSKCVIEIDLDKMCEELRDCLAEEIAILYPYSKVSRQYWISKANQVTSFGELIDYVYGEKKELFVEKYAPDWREEIDE